MSSVITPRECSAAYSSSPKSSPTGPTTRVSAKNEEASEKCTAEPPSSRSRFPVSVSTASNAMDPTTVSDIEGEDGSVPTMRAVVISEFGGPEVMQLVEDAPQPEPAEGQVLVKVNRAGINFADTHARENSYLSSYELPLTPGGEVAGEVDGQRVVALTGTGGYAEYALAPKQAVFPLPDGSRTPRRSRRGPGPQRLAPAQDLVPHGGGRERRRRTPPPAASARSRSSSPSATAPAA